VVAQLRGVLAAEESAEMSEEHHHDRPLGPEVDEAPHGASRIGQLYVGEARYVHSRTLPRACATMAP